MKNLIITLLIIFSTSVFSQKADTEKKSTKITVPKSEFFRNIKTYDLIVQGDETWNQVYKNATKSTYELNVPDKDIKTDVLLATEKADLKIIMGSGSFNYQKKNDQPLLVSNLKCLVLGKNNEIIYQSGALTDCFGRYPISKDATISIISDLKDIGRSFGINNCLINNLTQIDLNYGFFDKTKDFPELEEYNVKTNEFLVNIESDKLSDIYLSELQTYYKSFIGKEYKKIKPKDFNKVIYLNLFWTELLKGNLNSANEYFEKAKEDAGIFSIWPMTTKNILKDLNLVNQKKFETKIENFSSDSAYYININGTVVINDKEQNGLIKVGRYCDTSSGNIASLDTYARPKLLVYNEKEELLFNTTGYDKNKIKTVKGLELNFMTIGSEYVLVEKTNDGNYRKFENNSNEIFVLTDGKLVLKK